MVTRLLAPTPEGIEETARLLREGAVAAIPTETVYGLAADALNPTAVAAIFAAKERPMDNPLIVHIGDMGDWAPLVKSIPPAAQKLADTYWPGPLTIILPAADCIPTEVTGGLSTVAVRFPAHPIAQAVILQSGCPLAAPSANRSGSPSPTNAARVMEDMQGRIAAVLDGGDCDVGVESTVIDMSHPTPRLLRPGGITPEMLEAVLGPIDIDPAVLHALQKGAVAASPGMKYKHYAPKAQVYLVKGTRAAYVDYVNAHKQDGVTALCFDEQTAKLTVPAVSYGPAEDQAAQARQVFDALRQLDEQGAETVYAACPRPRGIGLAVYNRLLRAAAFRIINTIRIVGLTGPTGAGKSTVAQVWRDKGVPIIDADELARQVTAPDSPCLQAIAEAFSPAILQEDGSLNRAELARLAFATPAETAKLNAITHPAILALMRQQLEDAADEGHPVAVIDAPLLFEAGVDGLCHHVVAVMAPKNKRLSRIMARDGIDEQAAARRMAAQQADDFYCRDGVSVLVNDTDEETLRYKAAALWEQRARWWTVE
ncbi:MAG: threonylcarbamoyl-AMP synthase [Clostridia bacterium]|nr:threonylcarbamoyl-AMP synthase [Clostridia bacterium]